MSPLGFDAKKMYSFVAKRFANTTAKVQEQALNWLQTLTMLDIMIPLEQLFTMFNDGVTSLKSFMGETKEDAFPKSNDQERSSMSKIYIFFFQKQK